jgi:hypothetical protein
MWPLTGNPSRLADDKLIAELVPLAWHASERSGNLNISATVYSDRSREGKVLEEAHKRRIVQMSNSSNVGGDCYRAMDGDLIAAIRAHHHFADPSVAEARHHPADDAKVTGQQRRQSGDKSGGTRGV